LIKCIILNGFILLFRVVITFIIYFIFFKCDFPFNGHLFIWSILVYFLITLVFSVLISIYNIKKYYSCYNIFYFVHNICGGLMNGQIKRIDELGRIVIPIDIRKRLSIKDNDTLEIGLDNDRIVISRIQVVKGYNDYVSTLVKLITNFSDYKFLVTNRDKVIFNNTEISNFDINKYINLSLYDMNNLKNELDIPCDIRPVIIDSNVEGLILVTGGTALEEVGKIINILATSKLDISC